MKKNIIRLTEAELKQYISKVVAEQTTDNGAATQEANQANAKVMAQSLRGKNVQLYLDMGKTKKSHLVNITNIGSSKTKVGLFYLWVKDLSYVTDTGGAADPQDGMAPIEFLRFDCTEPNVFLATGGGKNLGELYNPSLSELAKTGASCATVNRSVDIASAKPTAQSNMAETVRVDIA